MSNENFNSLPEAKSSKDATFSRRKLLQVTGAAIAASALNRLPTSASPYSTETSVPSSIAVNQETENLPPVEVSLLESGDFYSGPGNKDFRELSEEPLPAGTNVAVNGIFGDFAQVEATYINKKGEEVTGKGYLVKTALGDLPAEIASLTIDDVPWMSPVKADSGTEFSTPSADQLTEQIGESYNVGESDFKLDLSLTAPSYEDPNQNHGILISNPDAQGDANNILAVVRTGEAWALWQINVPGQTYTNVTEFKEATPDTLETKIRVNQEGTAVQIGYKDIPDESYNLESPFYDQNRYVDLFAASAGNSSLIINKLSLQVPPTGEYITE